MLDQALRCVRDNSTLLVSLLVVTIMGAAWIIFEAIRSHRRRVEVFALRRRVNELETERASTNSFGDLMVLSSRWIRSGLASHQRRRMSVINAASMESKHTSP